MALANSKTGASAACLALPCLLAALIVVMSGLNRFDIRQLPNPICETRGHKLNRVEVMVPEVDLGMPRASFVELKCAEAEQISRAVVGDRDEMPRQTNLLQTCCVFDDFAGREEVAQIGYQ